MIMVMTYKGNDMTNIVELTAEEIAPLIKDDVVRPHLSAEFRTEVGRKVIALVENDEPQAVVCLAFGYGVPTNEQELVDMSGPSSEGDLSVVPYTLWSYNKGAGSKLINGMLDMIRKEYSWAPPKMQPRIVTMSPKTDMARDFHLKNGATTLSENETTNNFEYTL